jgi:hypothetical protein
VRTIFDQFAKRLLSDRLSPRGEVTVDHEISPNAQRADVAYTLTRPCGMPEDLLDDLAHEDALWECFHRPPDVTTYFTCVAKLIEWHGIRCNARETPLPFPRLWILSAGDPTTLRSHVQFVPLPLSWPSGIYATEPMHFARVVIISELPRTPHTLTLRLLGAGSTLAQAIGEIRALPSDSVLRSRVLRWVRDLRGRIRCVKIEAMDPETISEYEQYIRDTDGLFEQELTQAHNNGVTAGLSQGLSPLVRLYERRLGRLISDTERAVLVARFDTHGPNRLGDVVLDLNSSELAEWLTDPNAR